MSIHPGFRVKTDEVAIGCVELYKAPRQYYSTSRVLPCAVCGMGVPMVEVSNSNNFRSLCFNKGHNYNTQAIRPRRKHRGHEGVEYKREVAPVI